MTNAMEEKFIVWNPKEICDYCHLPSLYMCSPVSETAEHPLQYPNPVSGITGCREAEAFMEPWAYHSVSEVTPVNLVSILECWGIIKHRLKILHMWDRQFWTLYKCMCQHWFYGHTVMQMRWNYSEFQTKLRLIVYFCPANNNQILKHHILQLYCMCLERKFLDLLVFVLTY